MLTDHQRKPSIFLGHSHLLPAHWHYSLRHCLDGDSPLLPLLAAIAVAGCMCFRKTLFPNGYTWGRIAGRHV